MKYSELERVILHLDPKSLRLFAKYEYFEWLHLNNTIINKEQYDRYLKDLEAVYELDEKEKDEGLTK